MSERIYKLQPDRTLALRGFDDLGASAALHSATSNSFKVSGTFRDPADFAVLILYDADNFYEHPRLKYLPDFGFDGLTLTFDVRYTGLMALDSPKYATIDWPYLDYILADGTKGRVALFSHATQVGGEYTKAAGTFEIVADGVQQYDRLTLWYLNLAFDYIAPAGGATATEVAQDLTAQINGANWAANGALIPLRASAEGSVIRITADRPGVDGNSLRLYAVAKNDRLKTAVDSIHLTGGKSDAIWRVSVDFGQLGMREIRQMWLTFAPPLADGKAFEDTEWEASFTNWTLTGPEERRSLRVAGPNSVRVEENDSWCKYTGPWTDESGFFSEGYAKRTANLGATVTVRYSCSSAHDLYLGTSLYGDRGTVAISVDGGAETLLNCKLQSEPAVNSRRKIRAAVAPGDHTVTIRLAAAGFFYFDFLEAAVVSDVPNPLPPKGNLSPALDYSTDHTYKVSPARLMHVFDNLGYQGPMNEYIGVFWWNQRKRVGATIPALTIRFEGSFAAGDQVFLNIGGQQCGKSVFPSETTETIARHFEYFINANYVGVWATSNGDTLTITSRSPKPAYSYTFEARVERTSGSTGSFTVTGSLTGGQPGKWVVDPVQTPALNRGARDWHADFFRQCQTRGREIVVSSSMELVNPPDGFAAVFPDGQGVQTDVGFGSLISTHCAFVDAVRNYQARVFGCIADLQAAAGLTPSIQFGEYLWWFFTNKTSANPAGGMALYHPEIASAAQAALGRPLVKFSLPTDNPAVNGSADAIFLRNRLRDHVAGIVAQVKASHPSARFELLFPYDVNHPQPAGIHELGGALNRFINLPVEWELKGTSGFDSLKTEALDFGAWCRSLDLSRTAIELPMSLGWPKDSVRHLVPVFRAGYAWEKEVAMAQSAGLDAVNLWAFDHVCIFGLAVTPQSTGRSIRT